MSVRRTGIGRGRSLRALATACVPPRYRPVALRLARGLAARIVLATAGTRAVALRCLPDPILISLRERISLRRPIDYPHARLTIAVTSEAERTLRLRSCRKEPETVEWLLETLKPRDVLYDVGANVGAYSLISAHAVTDVRVYAFEPGYATYANLVENVIANGLAPQIATFPIALSDRTEIMDFTYASSQAGSASHRGLLPGRPGERRHIVLAYRLDDFARMFGLEPPTHLKIDVDGAELHVLRGARDTLRSPSLRTILVEVDESLGAPEAVRDVLRAFGWGIERDVSHLGGEVHNWIFRRLGAAEVQ